MYKGILFRSRLEARWAVFMDEAGIDWEFEPVWIQTDSDLYRNWLPDFRLPRYGQWAEVKGHLTEHELDRLLTLSMYVGGCGQGSDVVVLGHIPERGSPGWPVQLHRHTRSALYATPWSLIPGCPLTRGFSGRDETTATLLLEGFMAPQPSWAAQPLEAARTARFG
jgi:hypothetical protein